MTILDKITQTASNYPDRTAYHTFCPDDLKSGGVGSSLNWKQLDDYSSRLAVYLDRTLTTRKPVVVYGHKNPYMIVCFLACVKSGRAYCPVDISVPSGRLGLIIDEVSPELVLATEELPVHGGNILSLPSVISVIENETETIDKACRVTGDDVFYIIFTSGSTGTPKGVQITCACLDRFLEWASGLGGGFEEGEPCTFLNQAPFSFDLSVMDLYLALYTGGTLWAVDKRVQGDMKLLLKTLWESGAGVWVSTPSFADVCLSDRQFGEKLMPKLKRFLFCGETLTNHTAGRLEAAFPKAEIINTYGPTESTVAVTEVRVTPRINETYNPLPVGKEKKGTWILIVDEEGHELPDGQKGEMVIAGDTVSPGYWKNRKLTEEKFGNREIEGRVYRTYRTGDRGYRRDGLLFYCGRMDLQVKLHGYRIEIEDIESNLMKLPQVRQAAVVPVMKDGKARSLTAYVAVKGTAGEAVWNSFAAAQEIRGLLRQYLPEYMIPKKIVFLDSLPMTANGKADRKALGGNGS